MSSIFKAYDIRGIYPSELNGEVAAGIANGIIAHYKPTSVTIGRDTRPSSPELFSAMSQVFTKHGVQVLDLGIVSTPMSFFASKKLPADIDIMITASHNPPEYNGIKICADGAGIGIDNGLRAIQENMHTPLPESPTAGTIRATDIRPTYFSFLKTFADFDGQQFHIAFDCGNAVGMLELPIFHDFSNVVVTKTLWTNLGKPCPHLADPSKYETLIELQHIVRSTKCDIGIAFDGDADRVGFIDELGHIVRGDLAGALLARAALERHPGGTIVYDLISSRGYAEYIRTHGGNPVVSRVGHTYIALAMEKLNAVFGSEFSGHQFFNEGGYVMEKGALSVIMMLNLMAKTGKKLSELVAEIPQYAYSGTINLKVDNLKQVLSNLEEQFSDGEVSYLDGIKVDYPSWWFSVRASNTEPIIRLTLEATTNNEMELHKEQLIRMITAGHKRGR